MEEAGAVSPPKATIIIPAYNEEDGVAVVLKRVFQVLNGTCEVIVIDDGSDDATAEVAAGFPCRLIKHEVNQGKGEALLDVAAELRIPPEGVLAVGDGAADTGMFRNAAESIAFCPADEGVADAATHVVDQPDLRLLIPLLDR